MPVYRTVGSTRPPFRRTYTTLGCKMLRGRTCWCRGLCKPVEGHGACGRQAPHAMTDRIQLAIAAHMARRAG